MNILPLIGRKQMLFDRDLQNCSRRLDELVAESRFLVIGGAVGTSAVGASVAAVALPVALAASGAALLVKSVDVGARGTICVLERASDGATATIEIAGRIAERMTLRTGQAVQVSVVGAGAVLSVAGAAIAFVPSELGRALLHNERLTY